MRLIYAVLAIFMVAALAFMPGCATPRPQVSVDNCQEVKESLNQAEVDAALSSSDRDQYKEKVDKFLANPKCRCIHKDTLR